jgi:hypothetical protein
MKESTRNISNQVQAFRKAARDLGCDESEDSFARKLGAIAKPKAVARKPRRKAKSRG